ncbi:unnamed protein product [Prorocentrum cordatum]|uniref:RING-type domain-containing protein n=1 Tax=Prorocentrum cordatum TaxID=2364126 RepID=A0ABN9Q8R8_9DINO|nr:unnamed protein product [Polarella glacialis]
MLETIAVAGIWTRERRRAANLNQEGDDTCARCGEAIETEEHRYYACPANAEIGHSNGTDLAKKAKDALDQRQDLHFWLRGIPPAAWAAKVDPDEDAAKAAQIFCTSEEAQAAAQSGHKVRADYVFTDGSGGAGETARDPRLRRCGWAVVAFRFDEQGRPQEVAAWYGTIRAPHTVPRAGLTAMSKAIGYTTAATARGLNIVSDCKYALDALKQIQDPEDLDYRSTNYDLWLQTKQQLQNSTDTITGHHIPSHLIEHPTELERWSGPTWWVIGNEMADKYAGWGAEHGAQDPAIIVQQQIRDQITMAVQNRLLAINMAVMVGDPNKAPQRPKAKRRKPQTARDRAAQQGHDLRKLHPRWWCATCRSGPAKGQRIRDWLAETGKCLGKYGGHQDQHGNVRLDFKAVQIGTQVVHGSHKTQYTHGWLWCEKCGGTSYLGDHKSRIVAGVARKLARPCQPPTAAGRRVLEDTQRGKLPRGAKPAADPADEGLDEITMPGGFKLGLSNHEVIDLDGDSSEAGDPQPAPQQPPSHPYSVVHASLRLVDHMEGYAELWMNMVDQEVWDDMDDWMEHCVPYLLAITNVGGRTDTQEQPRAVTVQEIQQIKDFCEEVWRNTHRTRRRLMTRMLTLPHGTWQQAARVHMDAFHNRRNNIIARSIPSSERRPLPRTAEASREWSPENLGDDDSTPDSEAPELEGEPSSQEMETMAGPDQRHDANSLMQTAVQVAVTLTKPVGPDLMKFVSEADEAGLLHPRLRHNKGEADQDPEQEVAWLERNRLEQLMQSLAGCWSQKEGELGWPSWQAACVPHVMRALQTGVYQRLFSHVSGTSRQRSQRRAAEEICRLAWLNSGEERRQIQQQDPKEAERRRATAEQILGVTEPEVRSRRRSTKDMADLDHFPEEENREDSPQQDVDKQCSDDNHQQFPDAQHSIGYHLADRRAQPEKAADYDDTDLQRDLNKIVGDPPQRGEGVDRKAPLRGEGLGEVNADYKQQQDGDLGGIWTAYGAVSGSIGPSIADACLEGRGGLSDPELRCGHVYHSACFQQWLLKSRQQCPECRSVTQARELRPLDFDAVEGGAPQLSEGARRLAAASGEERQERQDDLLAEASDVADKIAEVEREIAAARQAASTAKAERKEPPPSPRAAGMSVSGRAVDEQGQASLAREPDYFHKLAEQLDTVVASEGRLAAGQFDSTEKRSAPVAPVELAAGAADSGAAANISRGVEHATAEESNHLQVGWAKSEPWAACADRGLRARRVADVIVEISGVSADRATVISDWQLDLAPRDYASVDAQTLCDEKWAGECSARNIADG